MAKRVGKLDHAVVRVRQALAVGQDEFLDPLLLEVDKVLDARGEFLGPTHDGLDVAGCGHRRSAAGVHQRNAGPLDLADGSIGRDTYVGAVDDQAVTIVGNVGSHGPKAGLTGKGKAGEPSQVEVVPVDTVEVVLQLAGQLVAA
ncbi:unnamed protein product [Pseudo-nitzschia multistriata]|uniref:Uncharacterized protein n=1 Tax=Pseudo-nitzschia multistriata TaxID=183589 RepID=A0A448Z998_9STRA|nr:unnamed protein product [Pseudo-nitzschia multistriata]